jgi:hypothetical protein
MILAFPNISLVVCALCLLIAVVAGVYRHWCKYLWIRTAIVLVANAGDEKPEQLRLGAYVPAWKSGVQHPGRGLGSRPGFRYRTGQQVLPGHSAH